MQALSRTYQLLLRCAYAAGERQQELLQRLRRCFWEQPLIAVPWARLEGTAFALRHPAAFASLQQQPAGAAGGADGDEASGDGRDAPATERLVFFAAGQLVVSDPGGLICGCVLPPALDSLYQGEALELLCRLLPGRQAPGGEACGEALVAAAAAGDYPASVALLEALGRALLAGEPLSWRGSAAAGAEAEAAAGEQEAEQEGKEAEQEGEEAEEAKEEARQAAAAQLEAEAESWRQFFGHQQALPTVTGAWVALAGGSALVHEALLAGQLPEGAGAEAQQQLLQELLASAELCEVQLHILGPADLLAAVPPEDGTRLLPTSAAAEAGGGRAGLRHLLQLLRVPSLQHSLTSVAAGANGAPLWLQDSEQIVVQQHYCPPASLLLQQLLPVAQRYLQLHEPARFAQLCGDDELAGRLARARAFLVPGLQVSGDAGLALHLVVPPAHVAAALPAPACAAPACVLMPPRALDLPPQELHSLPDLGVSTAPRPAEALLQLQDQEPPIILISCDPDLGGAAGRGLPPPPALRAAVLQLTRLLSADGQPHQAMALVLLLAMRSLLAGDAPEVSEELLSQVAGLPSLREGVAAWGRPGAVGRGGWPWPQVAGTADEGLTGRQPALPGSGLPGQEGAAGQLGEVPEGRQQLLGEERLDGQPGGPGRPGMGDERGEGGDGPGRAGQPGGQDGPAGSGARPSSPGGSGTGGPGTGQAGGRGDLPGGPEDPRVPGQRGDAAGQRRPGSEGPSDRPPREGEGEGEDGSMWGRASRDQRGPSGPRAGQSAHSLGLLPPAGDAAESAVRDLGNGLVQELVELREEERRVGGPACLLGAAGGSWRLRPGRSCVGPALGSAARQARELGPVCRPRCAPLCAPGPPDPLPPALAPAAGRGAHACARGGARLARRAGPLGRGVCVPAAAEARGAGHLRHLGQPARGGR